MVVFSQLKHDGRVAAKERRRETVLHSRLRDLHALKREAETRLASVRKSVFARDDGRGLREKLEPGYPTKTQQATIALLLNGKPTSATHDECVGHGECGCEPPIELGGDAYASVRECYRLLDGLRPFSRPRTAACRKKRIAQSVQVFTDGKSVSIEGVCTCGNANGCPVCARKIYTVRANEVEYMLDRWIGYGPGKLGPSSAVAGMLTLTIKHGHGDDLGRISHGLNEAFRKLFMGRGGQKLKRAFGLRHYVRAFETTHGGNGWHPHLHALCLFEREPTAEALEELRQAWREAVLQTLGQAHAPDLDGSGPGLHFKQIWVATDGKYVAKLGLEIAGIYTKKAKGGNRTYWQIARDAVEGDTYAQHLWKDAQKALFRMKMLTWSRGTRDFFELPDLTDEQVAQEGEVLEPPPLKVERYRLEVGAAKWDAACRRDRFFISRLVGAALSAELSGNWGGVLSLVSSDNGRIEICRPPGGEDAAYASTVATDGTEPRSYCHSSIPSSTSRTDTM